MSEKEEPFHKLCRLEICMIMHENLFDFTDLANQQTAVLNYILEKLSIGDVSDSALKELKRSVRTFVANIISLYRAGSNHMDRLVKDKSMVKDLPDSLKAKLKSAFNSRASYSRKVQKKPFEDKSIRGQYLEAQKLRESSEPGVIHLAASQNLTKAGKKDARFVFQKVGSSTGLTAAKAREAICTRDPKEVIKITPACALGFLLNQNLTRAQYQAIRAICKDKGADIWPSYKEIQSAKLECRPEEIEVSDHTAFVPLQQLLDQTTKRILELDPSIEANLQSLAKENDNQLTATLIFKYGFDGSGSHQQQMQPDQDGDHSEVKNLVATQLFPLQISVCTRNSDQTIWKCTRPNNPHSCRPLRLSFEIENKETSVAEHERLSTEIQDLDSFIVSENPSISISYKGLETLVDGKVVSNVTNGNTTRSTVCDATRSEMAKNEGPFHAISDQRLSFVSLPYILG